MLTESYREYVGELLYPTAHRFTVWKKTNSFFNKVDQTLAIRLRYDPDNHSTKMSFLTKVESAISIYIKYNICETAQNLPMKQWKFCNSPIPDLIISFDFTLVTYFWLKMVVKIKKQNKGILDLTSFEQLQVIQIRRR